MLSRLAARAALQSQNLVPRPMIVGIQKASTAPEKESAPAPVANHNLEDPLDSVPRIFPKKIEGPERDLVNFPRPTMKEHPDPVRFGFIPEEWFEFFYKKTGVSGPYMFGVSLGTYLLSKEIYVLEHNFYNGLSMLLIVMIAHHKFGPNIAAWADKEIEKWNKDTKEAEDSEKKSCSQNIEHINKYMEQLDVFKDVCEARRETAAAALEVTYREWVHKAHHEAKKRLDYQMELANAERRVSQKNMSSWITANVLKSITPAQEQEAIKKCIQDLKSLSATA